MTTVTVQYDLSDAMKEGAIRDKLIEMGWTPPQEQPDVPFIIEVLQEYAGALSNGHLDGAGRSLPEQILDEAALLENYRSRPLPLPKQPATRAYSPFHDDTLKLVHHELLIANDVNSDKVKLRCIKRAIQYVEDYLRHQGSQAEDDSEVIPALKQLHNIAGSVLFSMERGVSVSNANLDALKEALGRSGRVLGRMSDAD